jgi:hypothetical protein
MANVKSQELLIEELSPSQCNIISESSKDGQSCYLAGIFMQGGIKNRNNRMYPVSEISKAVTEAFKRINEQKGIFGELDHPQTLNINLERISHVITDLRMEGNNAVGRAKILETPMGKIARTLIESGVRLGVSSRGAGAVLESGMVEGFNFVTVDIVATPSAPGALPNSVFESLGYARNGRKIMTLSEEVCHDEAAQKYLKKEILAFVETLLKK